MKHFIYCILFCFTASSCVVQKSFNGANALIWDKDKPLTFKDFNGKPNTLRTADASIHWRIHHTFLDSTHYLIFACMDTHLSWHKSNSSRVLMHEQYHFNIAEAYARSIRRKVIEEKLDVRSKAFKTFYSSVLDECRDAQALYDEETKHSLNKKEQTKWQHRIDATLLQLDKYAENVITIL